MFQSYMTVVPHNTFHCAENGSSISSISHLNQSEVLTMEHSMWSDEGTYPFSFLMATLSHMKRLVCTEYVHNSCVNQPSHRGRVLSSLWWRHVSDLQHRTPPLRSSSSCKRSIQNTMWLFHDCSDCERGPMAYHEGSTCSPIPHWSWDNPWNVGERDDHRCRAGPRPQYYGSVHFLRVWEGNVTTYWEGPQPQSCGETWQWNSYWCLGTFICPDSWKMELLLLVHQWSHVLHTSEPYAHKVWHVPILPGVQILAEDTAWDGSETALFWLWGGVSVQRVHSSFKKQQNRTKTYHSRHTRT